MSYPTDLKYTKEHEWIRLEGDTGVVGITDFAQQQLGDVVYVELPEVGATLTAGQVFGTIESVKAVSELFAPVSGEVVEVNTSLKDRPETSTASRTRRGW
jgi:glycine cleavage system H protein